MKQRPVAVGLLVCEKIIIEAETRNPTLVNCFTRRYVPSFPSEPLSFIVFAVLTDGLGQMAIRVRIENLENLDFVTERDGTITFTDRLKESRVRFMMQGVSFPVEGLYDVILLVDDEVVTSRRIEIHQRNQ